MLVSCLPVCEMVPMFVLMVENGIMMVFNCCGVGVVLVLGVDLPWLLYGVLVVTSGDFI